MRPRFGLAFSISFCFILSVNFTQAQKHPGPEDRPKLVVGIVVDQMRHDYLFRYWERYGKGGFRRLLREGFSCDNTNINYVPTYTAPGHASVYTGTTPAVHGIAGNDWFDCSANRAVYCVSDSTTSPVGVAESRDGKMSPRNLLTSTITDELRLATNKRSRVISISLKDRAAILPGGHAANAAYWMDGASGKFITSRYYMETLPEWAASFNAKNYPDKYLSAPWNTLYNISTYTASSADNVPWEKPFQGETAPIFPHNLPALRGKTFDLIKEVPFGNTVTRQFAEEAILNENLGKGSATDFLAVSFSSTDYVGHQFGINAIETEDTYLRLDQDLETFLKFLDKHLGKENVLIFLTSDHGAVHNHQFLETEKFRVPGGNMRSSELRSALNKHLAGKYGEGSWILDYKNQQLYFNHGLAATMKVPSRQVMEEAERFLINQPGIESVLYMDELRQQGIAEGVGGMVIRGTNPSRSGDMYVSLMPGWMEHSNYGTTHGAPFSYDTHIPLLWYGWKIKPGKTAAPVYITDIAPTLAQLLNIQAPNGVTGKPIQELLK